VHKLPEAITITTSAPETRVLLLLFCILHVDKAPSVVTFWPDLNLALRKNAKENRKGNSEMKGKRKCHQNINKNGGQQLMGCKEQLFPVAACAAEKDLREPLPV